MKKVLAIVVVSLLISSLAFAQNFISGEAYENCNGTQYGVIGYAIDMETISIQGLIGLGMFSPADSDAESDFDFCIGARVIKPILEGDNACLGAYGGVIVSLDGSGIKDVDADMDIEIQAGLKPEVFLSDNVSVSALLGIKIISMGDRSGVSDTGGLLIGTTADPMANAVISYYFK